MKRNKKTWLVLAIIALAFGGCASDSSEPTLGPGTGGKSDGIGVGDGTDGCADDPTNDDCYAPPLQDLEELFEGSPDNAPSANEGQRADRFDKQNFELVAKQTSVKSQGRRGVCSIFSTTALMEHLYIQEGTITEPDFSEQYLQWSAKVQVGSFPRSSGSNAYNNLRAINQYGIPVEEAWPYEPNGWGTSNDPECTGDDRPTQCHTNGDAPQSAQDSRLFKLPRGKWISPSTDSIKAYMADNDRAVVAGMRFFYQSWNHGSSTLPTKSEYGRKGYILYPNKRDKEVSKQAGHSILIVGWDDELEVERLDENGDVMLDDDGNAMTEKGFFLIKNSWGTGRFGTENPHGAGYGWLSYKYVAEYARVYSAGLPRNVEPLQPEEPVDPSSEVIGEYESTDSLAIPDNDDAGIDSVIAVDAQDAVAKRAEVTVLIAHTYKGDLEVILVAPNGKEFSLHNQVGGSSNDIDETFSVEFNEGIDATGNWTLRAIDHARSDEGTIEGWSVKLSS